MRVEEISPACPRRRLLRRCGAGEEEGGGVVAGAGRRDEHPAFVLLGLMLVGDEGEAELLHDPGDRLVIVADDVGRLGEGLTKSPSGLKPGCDPIFVRWR